MIMRVNIQPQWRKLANWYWDTLEGKNTYNKGMSIWEMLEHDYGARQGFNDRVDGVMYAVFPDEKMYTAFLLRWS